MSLLHLIALAGFLCLLPYINGLSAKNCSGLADTTSSFVKMLRLGVSFLNLDPLILPNRTVGIPVLGGIALHDGRMTGLKTVRRTGPNSLIASDRGLSMTIDVGTGHIALNYTTTLSALFISADVRISVQVECTRITLHIKETNDAKLSLSSFSINSMQGLDVRLQALKVVDAFFNLFLKTATTLFKGVFENVAEIAVREAVNDVIERINALL